MPNEGSCLLGLAGLVVVGIIEGVGQLDLQVELAERASRCAHCCSQELRVKDRPMVGVRDLPIGGRRTVLWWRKRRLVCVACQRSSTEAHPQIGPRQRVTARFRRRLAERVCGGAAHAEVARCERTTRWQVARAFETVVDGLEVGTAAPRRLSLDEAHHRRGRELATVVSDLDRRCVVDVVDGCTRRVIERYLRCLPVEVRAGIEVVSIDPSEAYRHAIRAALPHARIVADRFHLVRGANTALDSVRRSQQRDRARKRPKGTRQSGRRSTWRPELYRARRLLLKASERLSPRERQRLADLFAIDPLVAEAWGLKEAFRAVYKADSKPEAAERLERFLAAVDRARLAPFDAFARGVRQWREELLAYYNEPTTNGYAEGIINKVKVVKRRAHGLPTFTGYRHRIPTACG